MNGRWITTWHNKGGLLLLFSSLLLLTATLRADWDFVTINQRTEQLYGPATPEARKRINEWQALLGSLPGSDEKNYWNRSTVFLMNGCYFATIVSSGSRKIIGQRPSKRCVKEWLTAKIILLQNILRYVGSIFRMKNGRDSDLLIVVDSHIPSNHLVMHCF